MATVRNWVGSEGHFGGQVDSIHTSYEPVARPGWTLLRTILSIELVQAADLVGFPPTPARPVVLAFYQGTNGAGAGYQPSVQEYEVDWVWWQQLWWIPDFGAISGPESSLIYRSHLYFDSKAQRKVLQDNSPPYLVVESYPETAQDGMRTATWSYGYTWRQLWEHTI